MKTNINITYSDTRYLLDAIETIEAEVEQLMFDHDWFVSDTVEYLQGSKQILQDLLGIREESYEELDD